MRYLKGHRTSMIKHAIAVLIGFFRRPGRFSVYHYPREAALDRLRGTQGGTILDVGCGSRKLPGLAIRIDLTAIACADVVADANRLPFRDSCCDGVWLEAVLEHVSYPDQIIEECARGLKTNGWLYCEVPFLQGEHSAPHDFRRWTRQGLKELFQAWSLEWIGPASGPFSVLAYQLRSCLSLLTCFGNEWLFRIMFEAVWGYVVWPIKFLDVFVLNNVHAQAHAFGYAIMLRRKPK